MNIKIYYRRVGLGLFFLLIFSTAVSSQDVYIVNADQLEVRVGAGKSFESIGTLQKGDEIEVIEFSGNWAKISHDGEEGFVNSKYIKHKKADENSDLKKSGNALTKEVLLAIFGSIWFWVGLAILVFLIVIYSRYNKRCKKCGKWNVMRKIDKVLVDQKASTILKKEHTRNSKGQVVRTRDRYIPATIRYFETHRKCKRCGYRDIVKTSTKTAN